MSDMLLNYAKDLISRFENGLEYSSRNIVINNLKFLIFTFPIISSTHTLAEQWEIQIPEDMYIVLIANEQTVGRGQRTQSFSSPMGNLYITIIVNTTTKFNYSLIDPTISLAVLDTLNTYLEKNHDQVNKLNKSDFKLKWVNDVYNCNSKIAGILCSSSGEENYTKFILSAGINLNNSPEIINCSAVCLKDFLVSPVDYNQFLLLFLETCITKFNCLRNNIEELDKIESNMMYLGEEVELVDLELGNILATGKFLGINQNGFALIEKDSKVVPHMKGRMRKSKNFLTKTSVRNLFGITSRKFNYFIFASAITIFVNFMLSKRK